MPIILFDHSQAQFKRWLLRNTLAIPIALVITLIVLLNANDTALLIAFGYGLLCLYIILWAAIFRRITLYEADGQLVCEFRFLGLCAVERKITAVSECIAVRYHAWQQSYGQDRISYHGAIYLHFQEGPPWRICDQGNFAMDVDCDEAMAEQLASKLNVRFENVADNPLPCEWCPSSE